MVRIHDIDVHNRNGLVLISGPCQLESLSHSRMIVETLLAITSELGIPLVFKGSYDKANRSSISGKRGVGMDAGLTILDGIRREYNIPVLTDIHETTHADSVAEVVDVLQIPAFLCRQTDLLESAAKASIKYKRAINVKKGQFLAPWDMQNIVDKFTSWGFSDLMLCERGTSFGYNCLVSDMTSLPIMAQTACPVIFDATHSAQKPGGEGKASSGNRDMVPYLARAAIAVGVAGLFIEAHEDPDNAPSDGPNMMRLDQMQILLSQCKRLDYLVKQIS